MKAYFTKLLILFWGMISFSINAQTNIISDLNPHVFGPDKYTLHSPTTYVDSVSHTDDGSGSLMFPSDTSTFLSNKITSKRFTLEQGKEYLLRFYVKMVGPIHGQNLLAKIVSNYSSKFEEMQFNVSEIGKWQEVILPFYAKYPGDYYFQVSKYKYLISTDGEYVYSSKNLATCPTVYIDDFSIVETNNGKIISNKVRTPKVEFESSYVKIDSLGNYSVKENGKWKYIFPRLAYRSYYFSLEEDAKYYSEYGFNGIVNVKSLSELKKVIGKGCKFNSFQINNFKEEYKDKIKEIFNALNTGEIPSYSFIMFTYDNEAKHLTQYITEKKPLSNWLDSNVVDPVTGLRSIPVFELNGVHKYIGRADRNGDNNLMDVTGCYITWNGEATEQRYNPINTIELMDKCDGLVVPSNIMQIQSYYHKTFIPSLFKGIIQGAKGLQFWRGGTTHNDSKKDFRQNIWADGIKGENGAFARIDSMLNDIIIQPLKTDWEATIVSQLLDENKCPTVAIGTRSKLSEGRNFLILANFADAKQDVSVKLSGITGTVVMDYFTKEKLAEINSDGEFTVHIDKDNNGYLVLEILNLTSINEKKKNDENFSLKQNYPNPFNPITTISYSIPKITQLLIPSREEKERSGKFTPHVLGGSVLVKLKVFDVLGKEVATLVNKNQNPGNYKVTFDASGLPSGIYYYKLKAGSFVSVKKMMLLK